MNIKKLFITFLIVVSVGAVSTPVLAQGATRAEQLQQIEYLTKLVTLLQLQLELKKQLAQSATPDIPQHQSTVSNPIAILNTNKGVIEIELFEDQMPITVSNFKKLADEDFYDGVKFHRVIEGFMIQGGDPITKTSDVFRYGTGGPGYTIPDEHVKGDLLSNTRGTIAMANSGPNSGGSQFFINLVNNSNLDFDKQPLSSKHPVFGRVVSGMDVVDAIGAVDTTTMDRPVVDIVIHSVTIR